MHCHETGNPPEAAVGLVYRGVERDRLRRAPRSRPIHVDLSHPAIRDAQALQGAGCTANPGRAFQRSAADAQPASLATLPIPAEPTDFVDGIVTLGGNGNPASQSGAAIQRATTNASMQDRVFYNADGELLIVPQSGALTVHTEPGVLDAPAGSRRSHSARDQVPGRSAGRCRARVHLRELRTAHAAARSRSYRHLRSGECARLEAPIAGFEDREGDFGVAEVRRWPCGRLRSITRRWISFPGAATTCRWGKTSTSFSASTR